MKEYILNFIRQYKAHLISWALFIFYEVTVVGTITGSFAAFWDYFMHYAINISLFYVHAMVVMPFALQKQGPRYWLLPLLMVVGIVTYTAISYSAEFVYTELLGLHLTRPLEFDLIYTVRSAWRALYFMGFATGYFFLRKFIEEKNRAEFSEKKSLLSIIENQRLQNELVRSQNAFLKTQINPHFLFNTLSFVYNSVRKSSTQAADAVMALSQMMRYALQTENEYEESELLDEIEHVENLIHIHQIRHEHRLQVKFSYASNLVGIKIIPLVLITLVENVFQHADLTREKHIAEIDVTLSGSTLCIRTSNLISPNQCCGHKIGLTNLKSRIEHAYDGKASLRTYTDEGGYFHAALSIPVSINAAQPLYLRQATANAK